MHTAKVVSGSVKQVGTRGMVFVTRCCDDPQTDTPWTVKQIESMTADDIRYTMEFNCRRHAENHKAAEDKAKLAQIIASIDCPSGDCGCSGSAS